MFQEGEDIEREQLEAGGHQKLQGTKQPRQDMTNIPETESQMNTETAGT
jgi:hypothetical protein